jgi:hypothetical protein
MQRFLLQFLSFPIVWAVGAFTFVGAQTFSGVEKIAAAAVFVYCIALFIVGVANFFSARLTALHAVLILGAVLIVAAAFAYASLFPVVY